MKGKRITWEKIETITTSAFRETTINFLQNEDFMEIFTSDNSTMTKIKKIMQVNPEEWECYEGSRNANGTITGYFIKAPKKYVSLRKPNKYRTISETERLARAENMKKCRRGRKKKTQL